MLAREPAILTEVLYCFLSPYRQTL